MLLLLMILLLDEGWRYVYSVRVGMVGLTDRWSTEGRKGVGGCEKRKKKDKREGGKAFDLTTF